MFKQLLGVVASVVAVACSQNPAAVAANNANESGRACVSAVVENDADLALVAGCSTVRGNLVVHGVSSLEKLRGLSEVTGTLSISDNAALENLAGLEALQSVDSLELSDNAALDDVSALANLGGIRSLRITGNPGLSTLLGLSRVTTLEELVILRSSLSYVNGLEGLRKVDHLVIAENSHLIGIGALNGVESVNRLVVERNPLLSGYFGLLRGLTSTPAKARVQDNRGLSADESAELARTRQNELASR